AIELADELRRRAGCRAYTHKGKRDERYPELGKGRDLRHDGQAPLPGHRKNLDAPGIVSLNRADRRHDVEIEPAGNNLLDGWCRALEGARGIVEAVQFLEPLEDQIGRRAYADMAIVELLRGGLADPDQLRE